MGRFDIRTRTGLISGIIQGATLFDSDAQAFIDRVTAAGGTLTEPEKLAVNTLTLNLKSANIWTLMKAIYPMVGSSAAACAQNLKSSSFTGTFAGPWIFTSAGAKGNGSSTYMNTGLLASTQLSISSAHLSVYINTLNTANVLIGANATTAFLQNNGGILYGALAGPTTSAAITGTVFFVMVNRQTNTVQKVIKNATVLGTSSSTASAYPSAQNIFVGAYNATGNSSDATFAFSSIGDGLSDAEAISFYNAIQTFQTSLSRQV